MIKIKRPKEKPKTLCSEKVEKAKAKVKAIAEKRKPLSTEFKGHWREKDVKKAIWEMQFKKCCYCERRRDMDYESDVEHFRPKAGIEECPDHQGYWWLAYEWDNLFFSCKPCNEKFKKNYFPLTNESKRAYSPDDSLDHEEPLLLNPCKDAPIEHLGFDWYENTDQTSKLPVHVIPRNNSAKGTKTIKVANLNRPELVVDRSELLIDLDTLCILFIAARFSPAYNEQFEDSKKRILNITASCQPYSAFARDFFIKRGLKDFISRD